MKSFQAVDGKVSSPQSRFLVSRTSTAACLCPTSTHSLPFDFELTRHISSVAKLDIVLLEPTAAPCARLAELAPAARRNASGLLGTLATRGGLVRTGTADLTSSAVLKGEGPGEPGSSGGVAGARSRLGSGFSPFTRYEDAAPLHLVDTDWLNYLA